MTAIALVSEINYYHINQLYLFLDTLYIKLKYLKPFNCIQIKLLVLDINTWNNCVQTNKLWLI